MWRMMLSPLSWVGLGLACVMLTSPARAAAASDDRHSSRGNADSAADGAAPVRDPRTKSERPGDPQSLRTSAQPGASSKGRSAAAVPTRARLAGQTSRPLGSNRAASLPLRGPGSVGTASAATPAASKRNALPAPKLTTVPRNSAIGGPRAQSVGRLGGAAVGRTNHSPAIDGTQFRPRF